MKIKSLHIVYMILLLSFSPDFVASQSLVTGKVIDTEGAPLAGANIIAQYGRTATTADQNGKFSISTALIDTLLVSHIGYIDLQQAIAGSISLDLILIPSVEQLDEIVVIGYGIQKKRDVTGAVGSVSSQDFNVGIINTPEQLIQGRLAGVELFQNDGEPGSAFTIRIRGTSTIRAGNDPLYVIDGYPLDINNPGPIADNGNRPFKKNPLEFLNPEDIESIDILKDASAAAIYGARGANGVVLITTRKGRSGQLNVSYSSYLGISRIRKIDVMNPDEFRTAIDDFGLSNVDFGGNTEWQDEVYRDAISHNHNLSMSGGSEDTRYRASINYLSQEGTIKTTDYSKYNGRFQLHQSAINDRLQLEMNLNVSRINDHRAPREIVISTLSQNPTWPVLDEDGNFFQSVPGINHPIAKLEQSSNVISTQRYLSNLSAVYKITDQLEYKIHLGGDLSSSTGKSYQGIKISNSNGRAAISERTLTSSLIEHTLRFQNLFNELQVTGLAGYSYQRFQNEGSIFAYSNFPSDNIPLVNNISAGSNPETNSSWKERNALQSYFGRLQLDYKGRYLLTANMRADGSTRFGDNNKYGVFPSAAIAWRISSENFLKEINILDELKIRVSWGITGNQEIPNKISQPLFGTPRDAQAIFGLTGEPTIGYAFLRSANPDLQWEETSQTDIGVDASFNNGRWAFTIDYFTKTTSDYLLFTQAASAPTTNIWTNLDGTIENKGWEGSFQGFPIRTSEFKWNTGVNFTRVSNTVNGLPSPIPVGSLIGPGQSGVASQRIMNDEPIGIFYGREWLGFDENGNDIFQTDEEGNVEFKRLGNAVPEYFWGWSNEISYKNWNLDFLFSGASGYKILNNTFLSALSKQNFQFGGNTTIDHLYTDEDINNSLTYSSRYLEDGSFIRLSNISLAYQFPVNEISWLRSLQIYVSGSNLLLWTDYRGYDPEVNIPIDNFNSIPSIGSDWDAIPRPMSMQLGFKVSFQ